MNIFAVFQSAAAWMGQSLAPAFTRVRGTIGALAPRSLESQDPGPASGDRSGFATTGWVRSSFILGLVLVLSGSLFLFSAPALAGCNSTCVDQAIEAADAACAEEFPFAGLQNLCQASFRRSVNRLTRDRLRCKREVLSLKGLVFANCQMSIEELMPNSQARRCVGQAALVESLQACDPDFQ
ncbi:MAG: hypothetical protein ACO4AI_04125 [Prochlorothrix sp.]